MANVFAILSAIALAASAFLAFKNKEKFIEEKDAHEQAVSKLQRSTANLESLQDEFAATVADHTATKEETEGLVEKQAAQTAKNDKIESEITSKRSETDANASKISEIESKLAEVGNIEELVGIVQRTAAEIERLTTEIAANEATLTDLTGESTRTESVIAGYTERNSNVSNKESYFSSTRISSIFPAYGFVTLPIGNSSGVVAGSNLSVIRGGEAVAKLRVSTVESGRAAAQIVPDSVEQETTLMVGDRVVPASDAK